MIDDLRGAAVCVEWPPTPDLAEAIAEQAARTPQRRRRPRWPAGLLAAVVVAGAAIEPARSAITDLLGITGGEQVVRVRRLPPAQQVPVAPGDPVSLDEARELADFDVRVPRALGEPTEVRFLRAFGAVTLVYGGRATLTQIPAQVAPMAQKSVGPRTSVQETTAEGTRALFVTGAPHVWLAIREGDIVDELSARLVDADVLLWDTRGVGHRLEVAEGGLAEAQRIAASLGG